MLLNRVEHFFSESGQNLPWRGGSVVAVAVILLSLVAIRLQFEAEIPSVAFVATSIGASVLVWMPGLAAVVLARTRDPIAAVVWFLVGLGIVGAALLGAWFISPKLGASAGWIVLSASSVIVAYRPQHLAPIVRPLLLMLLLVFLCAAVTGDHGQMRDAIHTVAVRYWPSVDSALPMLLLDNLMRGREFLMPFVDAGTHTSDRPPLQAGLMVIAYATSASSVKIAVAQAAGVAANGLWVMGLWALLKALRTSTRTASFVTLCVIVSGAVFFSTFYTWPKLLSAAYGLAAAALLIVPLRGKAVRVWIATGLCGGLAMLSHGAIAFGLLGLAPLFFMRGERRIDVRELAVIGVVSLLIYSPWVAYQKFVDPPGDRMVKWHLAGVIEPTEGDAVETIVESYKKAGAAGIIENKARNLEVFLGLKGWAAIPEWGWRETPLGLIREATIRSVLLSAFFAPLGLLAFGWWRVRQHPVRTLLALVGASSAVFLLLAFGDASYQSAAWLHHAPYGLIVLWPVAGFLAATNVKWLARFLFFTTLMVFVLLWIIDTGVHPQWRDFALGDFQPTMIVLEVLLIFVIGLLGFRWTSGGSQDELSPT